MKKKYIAPELEFSVTSVEDIMYASTDIKTDGLFGADMSTYLTYLEEGNLEQATKYYH